MTLGPMRLEHVALSIASIAMMASAPSCGGERTSRRIATQAVLGGDVAARVGADMVPLALVGQVAAAQHVTPRQAVTHLVDDAICATAARARGLDRTQPASWLFTAARGRATAERLLAEATELGPATDAEIEELTKQHWREVDRPPAVRVVHLVARKSEPSTPEADARAKAVATELREVVLDASNADEFLAKAKAVPLPGVEVVVEKLTSAFTADGVFTEATGKMDPAFAKGAFALQTPGETSEIVQSSFGWHVIRLIERVPEQRMGLEARRLAFGNGVTMQRAHQATLARLKALRAAKPIEISPNAELLTRSLSPAKPNPAP